MGDAVEAVGRQVRDSWATVNRRGEGRHRRAPRRPWGTLPRTRRLLPALGLLAVLVSAAAVAAPDHSAPATQVLVRR